MYDRKFVKIVRKRREEKRRAEQGNGVDKMANVTANCN